MNYNEVAATEPDPPMDYNVVPPTDEHGNPVPVGVEIADGYGVWLKADLDAEVTRRNSTRPDGDHIVPASTKNADLAAALEADDAAHEEI